MTTHEGLVAYWRRFESVPGNLNVHPDDKKWMETNWPDVLKQKVYSTGQSYIDSPRFDPEDKQLHLSLLPVPFIGNLASAKILIFLANPGFGDGEYFVEEDQCFRDDLIANLNQESNLEFPFFYLNPKYSWSGGYQWWQKRLSPIISWYKERKCVSYRDALREISNKVAAVEMLPYHSRDTSKLKGMSGANLLPSVRKARHFLAEMSHKQDSLKLLMRSHASWESSDCAASSDHYVHGPRTQGLSFNPTSDVGKKFIEYLSQD